MRRGQSNRLANTILTPGKHLPTSGAPLKAFLSLDFRYLSLTLMRRPGLNGFDTLDSCSLERAVAKDSRAKGGDSERELSY